MTGRPVAALVEYFTFSNSPYRGDARRLHGGEVHTGNDGAFELVGLPGRGLIAARAEKDHFLVGQGADKIPGADENGWFLTDPHICDPNFLHVIAEIKPAEGAESLTCDLVLDPGKRRPGTVEGPDGKPLAGCIAINLCPGTMSPNMVKLTSGAFTAVALDPKQPRPLFFRHDEKKLAAVVMAKGDESGPLTVRLQPAGTVTGRLIDEDDRPRSGGVRINVRVQLKASSTRGRYLFSFLNPTPRRRRAVSSRGAHSWRGL